ncbi:MAG: DUF4998 domain-containing protein [Mangrovibacterium sp.]
MRTQSVFCIFLILLMSGCKDLTDIHETYLDRGELHYSGKPTAIDLHPGRYRMEVQFLRSMDPNVVKYMIYWNDKTDSAVVTPTAGTDTVRTTITGLKEQTYSFIIVSFDAHENRSLESEKSGKVYGDKYEAGLLSRAVTISNSLAGLVLTFGNAEAANVATEVSYTSASGALKTVSVPSKVNTYTIPDNKGGQISLKSSFVPDKGIDTFYSAVAVKSFNPVAADYTCTGSMTDYANSGLTGPYPWNVTLRATSLTQVELVDNDYTDDVYHWIKSGGSDSYYGDFGVVMNFDADLNVISVVNKYGQPASNGRSAELDPSGVNKYDPVTRTLKVKYWMNQPSVITPHRTSFDETFTMK